MYSVTTALRMAALRPSSSDAGRRAARSCRLSSVVGMGVSLVPREARPAAGMPPGRARRLLALHSSEC